MSVNMPAKYVGVPFEQPAAAAGRCLTSTPNLSMIRPIIGGRRRKNKTKAKRRLQSQQRKSRKSKKGQSGGFLPSIGEPFVAAVSKYIAPIALYGIYKFINGSKTRKARK
jgi:hypothetical protein